MSPRVELLLILAPFALAALALVAVFTRLGWVKGGYIPPSQELPPPPPPSFWRTHQPGGIPLFLDIDGVLHRAQNGSFEFQANLRRVLDALPPIEIVLSTNWRINASAEYLRQLFEPEVAARICGVTPHLPDRRRADEIERYARERGLRRFVAVDDAHHEFPSPCDWLFRTDYHTGLDELAADNLINFVRERFA